MAQRRMFSKKITDTDQFLDMPMSAQCLYFHVNMEADDDGFVGNVKTIRRKIGASEDDLKLLIAKQFIIPFESGAVVIKDWRIHNYIRKDTYNSTIYSEEKKLLETDDNGAYTIRRRDVYEPSPQDRLGKDRLGKDRLNAVAETASDLQQLHELYQNNFGIPSPIIVQSLEHWLNDLPLEMIIEAMTIAVKNQKSFGYAEGIMKSWCKKNIKTIDDVKAEQVAFSNNQIKKSGVAVKRIELSEHERQALNGTDTPISEEERAAILEGLI